MKVGHGRNQLINDDIDKVAEYVSDDAGVGNADFFITGGTGFVGIWLLKMLLRLSDGRNWGVKITCLSRNPEAFAKAHPDVYQRVKILKGDVVDFVFPKGNYKYIIHAATETNAKININSPIYLFDSIVLGTKRVMEFAARCGCQKLLYVSSGAVYGPQPEAVPSVSELYTGGPDPVVPTGNALYGEAKRTGELISTLYASTYGFEAKIARLFAFVGPYLPVNSHFAIGNFIANFMENQPITIKGDGTSVRSYMYAVDMASWMLKILFDAPGARSYNIGSDVPISIIDLAGIIASLKSPELAVKVMRERKNLPRDRYIPSVERARNELGLRLNFDLQEAIKTTIQWYMNG
jgi:dTDP-glucose 4,6-dehydratase